VGVTLTRVIEIPITMIVREKSDMRASFFFRGTRTFQSIIIGYVITIAVLAQRPF
jgi:hypothetical protein